MRELLADISTGFTNLKVGDIADPILKDSVSSKFIGTSLIKYGKLYVWDDLNFTKEFIAGMHVPSDEEWKTLEMHLGMSQAQADGTSWRGTDEGRKLKHRRTAVGSPPVGVSTNVHPRWNYNSTVFGLDTVNFAALPGGYRDTDGTFNDLGSRGYWWSATESGSLAWGRYLSSSNAGVSRNASNKAYGRSVQCVRAATSEEQTLSDGVIVGQGEDHNGNIYDLVKIGTQVWTVQNIAATNYTDGTAVTSYDYDDDSTNSFYDNEGDSIWTRLNFLI